MLVAHGVSVERNRRLHRGQRHQLKQMIRRHVAQGAGAFVISAALFDANFLRRGDLHAVDVAAIPQGLKDAVAEAKDHDVLHRLFAEVVIDAVNLVFVQDLLDLSVELHG